MGPKHGPVERQADARRIAGRYLVERLLGEGGMASVHCVRDASTDRRLALKRLAPGARPRVRMLFEREYHTLATLKHPNIVQVFDYGADADSPYYTMELLEGEELQQNSVPMAWRQVCRWLRDVASTLLALHARRMLHRDLSPRNLWCTSSGAIKLIDFGAAAPFGTSGEVVGTPPFVPPEALRGEPLDERSDLYSLGALGYWLLTGVHAFPARSLSELPELFAVPFVPASQRVAGSKRADLPPIPGELDALLSALLSRDVTARPSNGAELIDRLSAIADLDAAPLVVASEAPFSATKLVGRDAEKQLLARNLEAEQGAALCFEAEPGGGRTRLLQELMLQARLLGAVVLHVEAEAHPWAYGAVEALALKLLEALPERARNAARPHADKLGHLSPRLRTALGVPDGGLAPLPPALAESRVQLQSAMAAWFSEIASDTRLVLALDNLHVLDDSSAAVVLALTRPLTGARSLVLSTHTSEACPDCSPAAHAVRMASTRVALAPLTREQAHELLSSTLGDVPNLPRLASRLHSLSRGNPRYLLDCAEHLVRAEVIRQVDGSWLLPADIPDQALPATRVAALRERISHLSGAARALAQVLAIRAEPSPLELCSALSEQSGPALFEALDALVRERVLIGSVEGYRFASAELRDMVCAELPEERRRRANRTLGEFLLCDANDDPVQRLKAGLQLLLAGDLERGVPTVGEAGLRLSFGDMQNVSAAVPVMEEILPLLRDAGCTPRQLLSVLAPLSAAALHCDRRLAARYADQAMAAFEATLHLSLARRLRPYLGPRLSLMVMLLRASLSFRGGSKRAGQPSLREAITLLLLCVSALTGVSAICIDPARAGAYAELIAPLAAFGRDHMAAFVHEFCETLAACVRDTPARAYARWRNILERLDRPETIRGFPMPHHGAYVMGALYSRGNLESYRDGGDALATAERLDAMDTALAHMSADRVRMSYYGNQGNLALQKHYRERVELHAIQQGSAWQVEVWGPGAAIMIYLRTRDAMGMKHDMEQLVHLSKEIPSLEIYRQRARGTYLLLRGQAERALDDLSACTREHPRAVIGWARAHGVLARAYNQLGRHTDARDVCLTALEALSPVDLTFPAMNLIVETEFALAEGALGRLPAATLRIDELLEEHGPHQSPLTLGLLHETRAELGRQAGELEAAREHTLKMDRWYRSTAVPTLVAYCERLRRKHVDKLVSRSVHESGETVTTRQAGEATSDGPVTQMEALRALLISCAAVDGFVLVADEPATRQPRFARSEIPGAAIEWAIERLEQAKDAASETDLVDDTSMQTDFDLTRVGELDYRISILRSPTNDFDVIGAVVAARPGAVPERPSLEALRALARAVEENTTSSSAAGLG